MTIWSSVIFNVVQQSVRYFKDGLVGNVLVRLNAKLDALEALGQLVLKLLLDRTLCRIGSCRVVERRLVSRRARRMSLSWPGLDVELVLAAWSRLRLGGVSQGSRSLRSQNKLEQHDRNTGMIRGKGR
ncbi:hypothetical protein J3458_005007 [Metarhizium acridum]|uniref:uncharacterized protein n=1 Tax=Metarhizium acridum TaxID=92637 RepID=UPI001C6B89D1|nr:hypothetical protein J3458_005007 [Metarhizium acridum]